MTFTATALTLPNDVLDRILQHAPTFSTLHAAICVSKTWYQVFCVHPRSIRRCVAENVVRPAFPEGVRFLRYAHDGGAGTKEGNEEVGAVTEEEFQGLLKNAEVVTELEAAFSLKYRDSLSRTSQLTSTESHRFARAIYRIMLYCAVFRMSDDEDQVRELEENQHDEIVAQRVSMLSAYSTQELFELSGVLVFLRAIAYASAGDREGYDEDQDDDGLQAESDTLISTSPAAVLKAHRHKDADEMLKIIGPTVCVSGPFSLLTEFFAAPLQRIWETREVSAPPTSEDALQGSILDDLNYRAAPCDQCGVGSTTKLRHEGNWDDLHLKIHSLLLGNLSRNFIEMEPLEEGKPERDIPKLISELYALKSEDFKEWKRSDALCDACFTKFVSGHLHLWLLERKLKDGWEAPEDCWYGYKCRTQTDVTLHAMTKNVGPCLFDSVRFDQLYMGLAAFVCTDEALRLI